MEGTEVLSTNVSFGNSNENIACQQVKCETLILCYGDKLARAMSLFMYCKEIMRSLPNGVLLRDFIFTRVLNQINHLFLRFNVYRT